MERRKNEDSRLLNKQKDILAKVAILVNITKEEEAEILTKSFTSVRYFALRKYTEFLKLKNQYFWTLNVDMLKVVNVLNDILVGILTPSRRIWRMESADESTVITF